MNDPTKKWRVLPPEGQGECDYDPELDQAYDNEKPSETRRNAATHQVVEALRLAREYALLRPGTRREEIKGDRLKEIKSVEMAWARLHAEMTRRRRLY